MKPARRIRGGLAHSTPSYGSQRGLHPRPQRTTATPEIGADLHRVSATILPLLFLLLVGCGEEATPRRYQVPHEPVVAESTSGAPGQTGTGAEQANVAAAVPQRMLAAIIPAGGRAWFVKATGTPEAIETQKSAFDSFLKSWQLESSPAASPQWTDPAGWKARATPGTMRFATLDAPGVEISVSVLPLPEGQPWEDYLLANVNRWRVQLQLEPATSEAVQQQIQTIPIGDLKATSVDLVGKSVPGVAPGMGGGPPPFAGAGTPQPPTAPPTGSPGTPIAPASNAAAGSGLRYTLPEGWTPGRSGPFRLAAFEVQKENEKAEVTLSALGAAAGSLLDNVNRWRDQIALPPITESDLAKISSEIKIQDQAAQWVDLTGEGDPAPAQAILAVVIPQGERTLFVKMMGNGQLVRAQKAAFEQFVRSLQFTSN